MKRLLLLTLVLVLNTMYGQITLEHTYTCSGGAFNNYPHTFGFFAGGHINYYTLDANNNELKIYDASHNLTNTINVNIQSGFVMKKLYLITDNLFDNDAGLEFIIVSYNSSAHINNMSLYGDDGQSIYDFGNQWEAFVIKENDTAYKLLTTNTDAASVYKIYSLPGTLSVQQQSIYLKGAYPVPASNFVTIRVPEQTSAKLIQVYNSAGVLVKRIDINGNKAISFDISGFSTGIYMYRVGDYTGKFIKK